MDFVSLITILENSLNRGCIMYKSSTIMQKTVNYTIDGGFQVVVNTNCNINNVTQIFFITENNNLFVWFEKLYENDVRKYDTYDITEINSLEVVT